MTYSISYYTLTKVVLQFQVEKYILHQNGVLDLFLWNITLYVIPVMT